MIRIWNERSKAIGGIGAKVIIDDLKSVGIKAKMGDSIFSNHEGVMVELHDTGRAVEFVAKKYGRHG